jgi:hypothetical protein
VNIAVSKIGALQMAPEKKIAIYSETSQIIFIKFHSIKEKIALNKTA